MFEYRKGNSPEEVAALFGDGIRLAHRVYVENPDTGDLLAYAGGLVRGMSGASYLLRWQERVMGLEAHVALRDDKRGTHPVFTLAALGSSKWARMRTRVAPVTLSADDAAKAMRVAAEACIVYETYREDFGPGSRVSDPDGSGRELFPADFGYPEITRAPWGVR